MEIENKLNKLINEYKVHLSRCDQIIEKTKENSPAIYKRHKIYQKMWTIMLNDLQKLADEISHEQQNQNKSS